MAHFFKKMQNTSKNLIKLTLLSFLYFNFALKIINRFRATAEAKKI